MPPEPIAPEKTQVSKLVPGMEALKEAAMPCTEALDGKKSVAFE
jgi:hypothetical protein